MSGGSGNKSTTSSRCSSRADRREHPVAVFIKSFLCCYHCCNKKTNDGTSLDNNNSADHTGHEDETIQPRDSGQMGTGSSSATSILNNNCLFRCCIKGNSEESVSSSQNGPASNNGFLPSSREPTDVSDRTYSVVNSNISCSKQERLIASNNSRDHNNPNLNVALPSNVIASVSRPTDECDNGYTEKITTETVCASETVKSGNMFYRVLKSVNIFKRSSSSNSSVSAPNSKVDACSDQILVVAQRASMKYRNDEGTSVQCSCSVMEGDYLLPPLSTCLDKLCLVIDLDETLVHSSFKPITKADFIVPVEIDGTVHQVYVAKRPHVDEFLASVGPLYECVLFTASLAKYADPVADLLDPSGTIFKARLFRDACVYYRGNYVKDLNKLGRLLNRVVILDNSPASYTFHPQNAVPVSSWFEDALDTELMYLIPFFERLAIADNVYSVLMSGASMNEDESHVNNGNHHLLNFSSIRTAPPNVDPGSPININILNSNSSCISNSNIIASVNPPATSVVSKDEHFSHANSTNKNS